MEKVLEEKKRLMSRWNMRADYSGMMRVIYEDDHSHGHGHGGAPDDHHEVPEGEHLHGSENLEI